MFFILGAALGMWLVPLSTVLDAHGLHAIKPFAFAANGLSAFVSPLIFGALADRHASPVKVLRGLSVAGFVGVIWTAWLGGKMAFEHGAGVTTAAMQAEIQDRAQSHHHHEGEAGAAEHEH